MTSLSSNGGVLLEVRDLRREYPTPSEPLVVLSGVDLSLERGGMMAIMGPSGSGKSTLLQIIGTLDRPTSGSVKLEGIDPFALAPDQLARLRNGRIGFIFQEHHLLPQCTALENVLVPALVSEAGSEVEGRARELLESVGLGGRFDHRPAELSGGERQRVAIARALINRPVLLLGDEPTGNLDRKTSHAIADILTRLAAETSTAIIAVTHSGEFAGAFSQRKELVEGRLVAAGAS